MSDTLTPEEIAEHTAFLEKIVESHREAIRNLTEPRQWAALQYALARLEYAIIAREEFTDSTTSTTTPEKQNDA